MVLLHLSVQREDIIPRVPLHYHRWHLQILIPFVDHNSQSIFISRTYHQHAQTTIQISIPITALNGPNPDRTPLATLGLLLDTFEMRSNLTLFMDTSTTTIKQ